MDGASQVDSSGNTWVASASSTHHTPPYHPWYAFNISVEQFWHNLYDDAISDSNTEWITIDTGMVRDFTHMIIKGRPYYDTQLPSSFKIQGSNDNTTWTDLYTASNKIWDWNNLELLSIKGTFRYIRIFVTKSQSNGERNVSIGRIKLFNIVEKTWTVADDDWCEVRVDGTRAEVSFIGDTTPLLSIERQFNVDYIQKISNGRYRVHFKHKLDTCDILPFTDSMPTEKINDNAYNTRISNGYVPNEEYVDISHGYYTTAHVYTNLRNGFVLIR
jgi:hypothetical protein